MSPIRKAVIPAAGLGTRLYPASKAVKKHFFPVVDPEGVAKPVIQAILEEAVDSGIEEVCVVVQAQDVSPLRAFFDVPPEGLRTGSSPERPQVLSQARRLRDLGERLHVVVQHSQEGFGHAVHCAKAWVGDAPFLLLLGDHVYRTHTRQPCTRQLLEAYGQLGQSVCALARTPEPKVVRYGTVAGEPLPGLPRAYRLTQIREKPAVAYARAHLRVPDLASDEYFCMFGQYALSASLFDYLGYHIDRDVRQRGEIQLTGALEMLRGREGVCGYETAGQRYDTGMPMEYVRALVAFSNPSPPVPDGP